MNPDQITYVKYHHAYKYRLEVPCRVETSVVGYSIDTDFITLTQNGMLIIRAGYNWDGPSGPSIDTRTFMRGSLVHDALYQLMRLGELPTIRRKMADNLMRELCLKDGMSRARAWWCYKAVRLFASKSAKPGTQKRSPQRLTAP